MPQLAAMPANPCGQWLWNAGRREPAAGPDAERDDLVVAAVEQAPVVSALGSRPSGRASADHGAGRDDADAQATVKICSEGSARRSGRRSGYPRKAAVSVSQLGLWTKSSVRHAAFSTAITKHTRSGPRLGNGAFVYLTEIGSM